jgi:hypothetical protein
MIPLPPRLYAYLGTGLLIAALVAGLVITRGTLDRTKATHAAELSAIRERTAQVYADAAGKALAQERLQTDRARKSADDYAKANTTLSARYDGLWKQFTPVGAVRPARLPSPSEAAAGASARPCSDGLWGLPLETAVALMFEADKNTLQLQELIRWHRAQEDITR